MNTNTKRILSNTELASFSSQFFDILRAGISPGEGIAIMLEDCSSPQEREILTAIQDTLNTTGVFSAGLEDAGVFPEYMLNMVRLGEQAGRLDEVMEALSLHYEREAGLAAAIKSAVTYPCIMIGMMLLVVLVLVTKVLPVFHQVFAQFGTDASGMSGVLMNIGIALNHYSLAFVIVAALLIALFLYFSRTESGRTLAAKLFSGFGPTRSFYHKNAACRFASGMSLTLKSGLTPEEGLKMAGELVPNPAFHKKVDACFTLLTEGAPLAEALSKSGIFTGVHARILLVGDRTGSIDDAMQRIASQYEEELDESIGNAISIIEPTLVAVLSIIVGLILLSVMMPLMGILSEL